MQAHCVPLDIISQDLVQHEGSIQGDEKVHMWRACCP